MHRFYADPDPNPGASLPVGGRCPSCADSFASETRPACRNFRSGSAGLRNFSAVSQEASLKLLFPLPSSEPSLSVTLYQGLPKSDKMDLIVQKAVELGVTRIVPVLMERCVSRPDPKDSVRKLERWRKIAREACKQSGRCIIPRFYSCHPRQKDPSYGNSRSGAISAIMCLYGEMD